MPILTTLGAACARAWGFTSGLLKDPYFNLTSLLLPGNGTNGAQNNTFLDSSTNNFTITRNGNTTQGTFSPFSQTGWGAYFDGSNDSLTIPSGSSISGTGNFTVECWMYPLTFASGYRVFYANETSGGLSLLINSTGTLSYGRALVAVDGTTTGTVNFNQWNHVAFVRSGTGSNQFICYINGQSAGSFTNSTSYSSGIVRIGTDGGGINYPFPGYLSNIRSVIIAVYTGNFTPPIAPLTATQSAGTNISAITGTQTSLLTCQSNRFVDNGTANSGSGFIVTAYNGTAITPFSPFAPTAAYTTAAVGGSGYFDGTGDYLEAGTASNWTFLHNGSSWTVEFDVYHPSTSSVGIVSTNVSTAQVGFTILINSTAANKVDVFFERGVSGSEAIFSSNAALVINSWNHVAITFDTSTKTCSFYINGVAQGSSSNTGFAYSSSAPTYTLAIGRYQGSTPGGYLTGYLANIRISNSVRTGLTTVPTAPYTSDANTSLLLNFTNAGITDATAKNDLETVGNAQISTSVSKFGGGSMYFDGTGDYLVFPNSQNFALGSGDFTVEAWVYVAASKLQAIMDTRLVNSNTTGIALAIDASNFPYVYVNNATLFTSSTAITLNTWTHLAMVRSSGTITLYINGTKPSTGSAANTTNLTDTALTVGSVIDYRDSTATLHFNGYIDDLRITKGYARYVTGTGANAGQMVFNGTNTLALPTAPFPVQ